MTDKKQKPVEEIKVDPPKAGQVFTKIEVDQMLVDQQNKLREKAVNTLMTKNQELKEDRILAGQDEFYNVQKWEVMRTMANDMVQSGALPPSDNVHTIMIKMQAGREMGLKPIESIKAFYIVKGVLNIYGDAVIRRLREHGWLVSYKEKQDECIATITKGEEVYSETFTFQDAEKSGWTKANGTLKAGWVDGINRRRKLRYGAISTLIKTFVPEVLGSAAEIAEVAQDTMSLYEKAGLDTGIDPEQANKAATPAQIDALIMYADTDEEKEEIKNTNYTYGEAAALLKEKTKGGKK